MSEAYQSFLFGPDSVWVNITYGDRRIEQEGDERQIQPEPRPLDAGVFERLLAYQEQARQEERPIPTEYLFDGMPLLMYPHSGGLTSSWRFILRNQAAELKIGMGTRNGIIGKLRFSAEYLWKWRNLAVCLLDAQVTLADSIFDAPVYLGASEIHLCVDMAGYDFAESAWQEGFIRRSSFTPHFQEYTFVEEEAGGQDSEEQQADGEDVIYIVGSDRLHMRYRRITGFTFGSHKSAVSAVIYNKSHYIASKAKATTWFYELWKAAGWDGIAEVWRVELRFKRPALREMGITSAYDLPTKLSGMWQYGTQKWLRYVVPEADSNRTRWQVHAAWGGVQRAYQQGLPASDIDMGPIIREQKRVANMQQLVAQLVGCFITLHAWYLRECPCPDDEDISTVLHHFYPNALDYQQEREEREKRKGKQWSFSAEVRYRQRLYSQLVAVA